MPATSFTPPSDEAPATPLETRIDLLGATKRAFTPVRHSFVQLTRNDKDPRAPRGSKLADLVRLHQERALDAFLLVLALEPILSTDEPLYSAVWGRLISDEPLPEASISRCWNQVAQHGLISKRRRLTRALVTPRREDGKAEYSRPGGATRDADTGGWPRADWYFVIPNEYWTDGWDQRLSLRAKAMLLVSLQATSKAPSYYMPLEEAENWYGISRETAQRGLAELVAAGLMTEYKQVIKAPKSPIGSTVRIHYSLVAPFSTHARRDLRAAAMAAFAPTKAATPMKKGGKLSKGTASGVAANSLGRRPAKPVKKPAVIENSATSTPATVTTAGSSARPSGTAGPFLDSSRRAARAVKATRRKPRASEDGG